MKLQDYSYSLRLIPTTNKQILATHSEIIQTEEKCTHVNTLMTYHGGSRRKAHVSMQMKKIRVLMRDCSTINIGCGTIIAGLEFQLKTKML